MTGEDDPGLGFAQEIVIALLYGGWMLLMWLCLAVAVGLAAFLLVDYRRDRRRRRA